VTAFGQPIASASWTERTTGSPNTTSCSSGCSPTFRLAHVPWIPPPTGRRREDRGDRRPSAVVADRSEHAWV